METENQTPSIKKCLWRVVLEKDFSEPGRTTFTAHNLDSLPCFNCSGYASQNHSSCTYLADSRSN